MKSSFSEIHQRTEVPVLGNQGNAAREKSSIVRGCTEIHETTLQNLDDADVEDLALSSLNHDGSGTLTTHQSSLSEALYICLHFK